jgi:hypothetical protein
MMPESVGNDERLNSRLQSGKGEIINQASIILQSD